MIWQRDVLSASSSFWFCLSFLDWEKSEYSHAFPCRVTEWLSFNSLVISKKNLPNAQIFTTTAGAFLGHLYLSTGAYCPDNRAQNPSVLLMDVLQALLDFLPWYEKHHLKGQVIAVAMVTGFIFNFISYGYRTGRLNRSKWWADDSSASLPLSYQNKRLQH